MESTKGMMTTASSRGALKPSLKDALEREIGADDGVIRIVPSLKVFNLPLFEAYLVIDCRRPEDYQASRIMSSFNYPVTDDTVMTEEERKQYLLQFTDYMASNYIHERWDPLVLIGYRDHRAGATEHLIRFANDLKQLIVSRNGSKPLREEASNIERFLYRIAERSEFVWVLEGGFETFQDQYPILCSSPEGERVTGSESMVPLPYHLHINEEESSSGLFISSRGVKWNAEFVQSFRVDAVICDQSTATTVSTCVMHSHKEVDVLECALPDHGEKGMWTSTQIHQLFDNTSAFIQAALEKGQRIVVHLFGRSYSAAVCIAWFMRFRGFSLDEATQLVLDLTPRHCSSKTSVLDQNLMCREELLSWNVGHGLCSADATDSGSGAHGGAKMLK